jgi:hypothetical protein
VDILFTVTVSDDPFADGLFLTNQVRQVETSTNAGDSFNDAIVQINLGEPALNIQQRRCWQQFRRYIFPGNRRTVGIYCSGSW